MPFAFLFFHFLMALHNPLHQLFETFMSKTFFSHKFLSCLSVSYLSPLYLHLNTCDPKCSVHFQWAWDIFLWVSNNFFVNSITPVLAFYLLFCHWDFLPLDTSCTSSDSHRKIFHLTRSLFKDLTVCNAYPSITTGHAFLL